jgi:hypothetical protein
LNKLALLAFSLLIFFSSMLWYLADGSLNEYLKSQVLLQGEYYTNFQANLREASYESNSGIAVFHQFTLKNKPASPSSKLIDIKTIKVTLTNKPIKHLNAPSIDKKTTTLVNIEEIYIDNVNIWSTLMADGENSLNQQQAFIISKLAQDFPVLYPQVSAERYAKKYPERSEQLALQSIALSAQKTQIETNQAVIIAKQSKQQKRLLGKAKIRVKISSISIGQLSIHSTEQGNKNVQHFTNIALGELGGEHGLASNQLGGELLNSLITKAINLQSTPVQ